MKRLAIAFVVAPVIPAMLKVWELSQPDEFISFTLLQIVLGTLYAMQFAVGVPGHVLLDYYDHHGLGAYLLLGFLVVSLPLILASLYWSASPLINSLFQAVELGMYGVPMGAVFWLIARPDRREDRR